MRKGGNMHKFLQVRVKEEKDVLQTDSKCSEIRADICQVPSHVLYKHHVLQSLQQPQEVNSTPVELHFPIWQHGGGKSPTQSHTSELGRVPKPGHVSLHAEPGLYCWSVQGLRGKRLSAGDRSLQPSGAS